MTKIATLNRISPVGLARLPETYTLTKDLEEAEGLILRSADLHETEFSDTLLGIARAGAGFNNIPIATCARKGIVVFNTPGANANAVKELVLAAMLGYARNLTPARSWEDALADKVSKGETLEVGGETVNALKYVEKNKAQFAGTEIAGKKLGVIGMGAIGVLVANAAEDLNMEVTGYDPYLPESSKEVMHDTILMKDDLKELVSDCDYITIHVPAGPATMGMLSREVLAAMKPEAVLLNFARNTLVDEEALIEALNTGKLQAYITDFGTEALMNLPNVTCYPHLGASTKEAEDNCAVMAVLQLKDYLELGNIRNSVNYPACDLGRIATDASCRLAVMGEKTPDLVQRISNYLKGVAIVDMVSRVRGEYSYGLLDLNKAPTKRQMKALEAIDGVVRLRLIEKQ